MRTALYVGAIAAAIAGPASAQIPVTDAMGDSSWVTQLINAAQQLEQLKQQYDQLQQTYQQTVQIYNSMSHLTATSAMGHVLNSPVIRNSMPSSQDVADMAQGGTAPSGGLSALSQFFAGQNQVYVPSGTDASAVSINRSAQSLANMQAMAIQSLQSVETRSQGIADIQAQIDGQPDVQAMAAIQARLAAEQNYVAGQQVQAQQLSTLAAMQAQAQQQAAVQRQRQDADALLNNTQALDAASQDSTSVAAWSGP